jgi:hypothetical protein
MILQKTASELSFLRQSVKHNALTMHLEQAFLGVLQPHNYGVMCRRALSRKNFGATTAA